MAKQEKYIVWIGFKNYLNEIEDKTIIATFYSRVRAYNYVAWCNSENEEKDRVFYGIDEVV